MSAISKALAKKVAAASVSGGGNNIQHGKYILTIKRIFCEKKYSGECFIMEMTVLDAQKIEVVEGDRTRDITPNSVGSDCSYVVNFDGKGKQSAAGNVKQVICAIFGVSESDLSASEFEETFEDIVRTQPEEFVDENGNKTVKEANPMRGYALRCSTYPKAVRSEPGRFITGLKWETLATPGEGENSPEKVAERRKAMDGVN
jgi:hypothetical protein